MTDLDVIRLFEQTHPANEADIKALGLTMEYVGSGGGRSVYRLTKTLVVKLLCWKGSNQTRQEIAALEMIHTEPGFEKLRDHTPPLYYGDPDNGVILTKYYPNKVDPNENIAPIINVFNQHGAYDLFDLNMRRDEQGKLYVIDLGCSDLIAQME